MPHRNGLWSVMSRAPVRPGWVAAVRMLIWAVIVLSAAPAWALTAIEVGREADRIEINGLGTPVSGIGDRLQMETAPGADGLTDRMSVPAATSGSNPRWFVFALRNVLDVRVERWLSADRYNATGSGLIWPRLDMRQIEQVTPSLGFLPENLALDGTDAFRLTIEPGQTVTFAVELAADIVPRLTVSRALDYEKRARNKQLFHGVLLGITGLLAVFLSAVFAANHKAIFPAAALFTWCVLAYLCVDFGFWHKLFNVRPEDNAQYRAATEAGVAATLLIFMHVFLRLGAWHGFANLLLRLWIVAQLMLVGMAFIDPRLAATFARLSVGIIYVLGTLFVAGLALRGQDRALSLVPSWMLLGVWVTGMAFVFAARLQSDAAVTGLTSGLVLIVLIIGFTVTQYAFRAVDPIHALGTGDQGLRLMALENSGAATWEWNARRDEIAVGAAMEAAMGLAPGDLHAGAQVFLDRMHPVDRDRLRQALDSLKESGSGELRLEFRMRHIDNDYRWFALEAATDPSADRRRARCVGLVRETTDSRSAQERFVHDSVRDAVTGLPNRALFLDRLGLGVSRAQSEPLVQPAVIVIDVDRMAALATATQHFEADGLLIAVARRLTHLIGAGETLARIGQNQFGVLVLAQRSARELQALADGMHLSVRALIKIGTVEITPSAAVGFAVYDRTFTATAADVLDDAEIAMHRARKTGHNAALRFTPDLRTDRRERDVIEADLRDAIDKKQLTLLYQPIHVMRTQQIAGYEVLVRWEHPRLGKLDPTEFVPADHESDLIMKLGSTVVAMAVADLQRWHATYDRPEAPLTVSVNVSRRQLFGNGLVNEIRGIIAAAQLPKGCLRLEITEALVMENPEHAASVLSELAAAGAGLSLDDFGTGYSSLTYLNAFPFDTIKIDRALVHGSSEAGSVSAILRSVVVLAHEIGKKVVAEGIETDDDAAALRSLGCEYAQGPFYESPQSAKDVVQSLKELRKADRRLKRGGLFKLKERKAPAVAPVATADAVSTTSVTGRGVERQQKPPKSSPSRLAPAARMVAMAARQAGPQPPAGAAQSAKGSPAAPQARAARSKPAAPLAAVAPSKPAAPSNPPGLPAYAAGPNDAAARAASASLAELGAHMARPSQPPPMPQAAQQLPESMLDALARSMSDAAPPVPPVAPPAAPPERPAPSVSHIQPRPAAAPQRPIDFSTLPPGIAASLARLAGQSATPAPPAQSAAPADSEEPDPSATDFSDGLARLVRPSSARR